MGYLLGISPFRAILGWVKQLGALHPKGTTIFPMKKKEANNCLPRNHDFRCAKLLVPNGGRSIPLGISKKKHPNKKQQKHTSNGDVQSKSEKMWKVTTKSTNHLAQKNLSNFCCVLGPASSSLAYYFRNCRSKSHGTRLRNEGATLRKEDARAEILAWCSGLVSTLHGDVVFLESKNLSTGNFHDISRWFWSPLNGVFFKGIRAPKWQKDSG